MVLLGSVSALEAQVDERLVTKTWKTDNFWAETFDRPYRTFAREIEDSGESFYMFNWDSKGRIKFDQVDLNPSVWLGYKLNTITAYSGDDFYNHAFGDVAISVGGKLATIDPEWTVLAGAGMGTANDGRWDNTHALYGAATLEFQRRFGATDVWHVGLTYDGNRGFASAIPLPYFMVEVTPDPSLTLWLGFPETNLTWRPTDFLTLSALWRVPSQAWARVDVDLGSGITIFTAVTRRIDGFHIRDQERQEVFFEVNTAEVGVRWANPYVDFALSAGMTFGMRTFIGDDIRHRSQGISVEDMPFIGITVPGVTWPAPRSANLRY